MCGRYSLHHKAREVAERFDAALSFPFEPRYNIAPSQEITAVLADPSGNRTLEGLRWGLVPHWTRDIAAARRPIKRGPRPWPRSRPSGKPNDVAGA